MSLEQFAYNPTALAAAVEPGSSGRHFVYRTGSGQILLESDANLLPPKIGMLIHLPSPSDSQEIIIYRVKEVWVARESVEKVTTYVEVEPAESDPYDR